MKGLFVRIGIDQTYGRWNAPVDPETGEFLYVPIPENKHFRQELERGYDEIIPSIIKFANKHKKDLYQDLKFPIRLSEKKMHLDPDFKYLTYGDVGTRRGLGITSMGEGDFVAFYASLRPIKPSPHKLIYALVGFYVVEEVLWAGEVSWDRWHENAHTRRLEISDTDVIVRAKPSSSGRLVRCIPIGEWRKYAYRVRKDLIEAWGGLSVKNGYIQRSIAPPSFLKPEKFLSWLNKQNVQLIQRNNNV